ncbi:MAG: TonB-dependent receptor plug domain-containing protein [Chlorobium sp.]|uniref:TonB-dependent receptor plug domain-containing protein n=1 Tax=Chlorobium sp. TaxID=1095 RepID=UPI0025C43C85|nr:TonB-dependent receptor plug domain-containing protein [Chlorobium sp.]MCF8216398.1 TonB-dependent receptor plug domain-containing protein [Chlorobium sp.]MCF8287675.1 TonB-dependent receptor plug domain-containing protein [Chlorobium sp.]MCF8385309.1 TonB-dependent receptor plug domain-containing protein [Chlorobium sp.]
MGKRACRALMVLLVAGYAGNATAEEKEGAQKRSDYTLRQITVFDDKKAPGRSELRGDSLRAMPNYFGSITGALKGMADVQFSNDAESGLTSGEIRPPQISISGAKPYENAFVVDGIGNTNTFNPSGLGAEDNNAGASFNDLSVHGAEQNLFYDTALVESVSVFSSNIPAKYGGFTGGVVSAGIRDPRTDRWHFSLSGKHSRDEWFLMRGVDGDSEEPDNQPDFSKYRLTAIADGPLSETVALMVAASRQHSVMPLVRRDRIGLTTYSYDEDDQHRTAENYFLKLVARPSDRLRLTVDATYAPYEERRWRAAWADSDWKINNEAFRLALGADWTTDLGVIGAKTAWQESGYSRENETNYRYSSSNTGTKDAEQYGGVGDATNKNRTAVIRVDFQSVPLDLPLLKGFSTGLEFTAEALDMWNEEAVADVYVESAPQILHTLTRYLEHDQSKSLATLGYYASADLELGRLLFTPGFRIDYDDFTGNADIAHRLKAEFDTFGNSMFRFVSGYNRYYGTALRAYAFDRYRPYLNNQWKTAKSTGVTTQTITDKVSADYSFETDGLATPYSDEVMGGIAGSVGEFSYGFKAVKRNHRKQLLNRVERIDYPDGSCDYRSWMTNEGKGSYEGLSADISYAFDAGDRGKHSLTLGAAKSWIKTFNGNYYDNAFAESNGFEREYFLVYYDGEPMLRAAMPADNFNAPLAITFTWQGSFFNDQLRLYSVNRWRDWSKGLKPDKRISSETPYGTTSGSEKAVSSYWLNETGSRYYDAYVIGDIAGGFMSDLSVEMDLYKSEGLTATLTGDVYNLFNASIGTSVAEGGTVRGRGYYVGFRCDF